MSRAKKSTSALSIPYGWHMSGANPEEFDASIDNSTCHSGTRSAFLTHNSTIKSDSSWGTLMQTTSAKHFLAERVRMSVWIKTASMKKSVHAWMSVSGPKKGELLSFDNMCNRPIKEVRDWTQIAVVLDVPAESTDISFGVYLMGKGRVWIDDFSLEKVDTAVPVTDCPCSSRNQGKNKNAKNLNFEMDD